MKSIMRLVAALCLLLGVSYNACGAGWPANFQGVMLQGFYWDSYSDTKWTNLESQADELSQYFKLIWVPNSGKAASNGMGYDPVYWFTNHNSRFGSDSQIRQMIKTYKEKGVGIIADVVINHRSGVSNWTDFPSETWNGTTWKIGLDGICSTDEVNQQSGQAHGTGAADTGEDFNGARDLDHTNANVQNNCKNYCKFLLTDMGYAGFRYDMTKGYGAQYTKIYNQYSNPTYSVGEYWDGSYDNLKNWVEGTGRTSATFDFAFKYAVNEAFSSGDMSKLVWLAGYTTPQPAGLIHLDYQQYAVTFIDNHDTARDDWNKFNGNVVAANAFMLCSPGTPCVFLAHWKQYKEQIKKLIEVRNKVGVTNTSKVTVLKYDANCYMAEVTGTNGRLVVKIGPSTESPAGWTSSQIYCSGTDYCVWSTAEGGTGGGGSVDPTPTPGDYPATLYLQGHVNGYAWSTTEAVAAKGTNGVYTYPDVTIDASTDGDGFFSFATTLGATWDDVNSGDRYGSSAKDEAIAAGGSAPITLYAAAVSASACNSWKITPGVYTIVADLANMTLKVYAQGEAPDPTPDPTPDPGTYPAKLYLQGHVNGYAWSTTDAVAATPDKGVYTYNNVTIDASTEGDGYFSFATVLGATWDDVNSGDRYGSASKDQAIALGETSPITLYAADVSASACNSWKIAPGAYTIVADLANMTLTVKATSGIDDILDDTAPAVYYNLQGIPVTNPGPGIYIRRQGTQITKIQIR